VDTTWLYVIVAFAFMIVAAAIGLGYYGQQKRIKQLQDLASRLGYEFVRQDDDLLNALEGSILSSYGRLRRVPNLLRTSVDGTAATIFDYSYETGTRKSRGTYRQTVLLLESERLNLPSFALFPDGFGQKLLGLAGKQDIDFENQSKFSKAYVLQGPNEAEVRALFNDERLAFFAQRPGLCVEGGGRRLLYYRTHKRVSPTDIPSFLEEGLAVLRALSG